MGTHAKGGIPGKASIYEELTEVFREVLDDASLVLRPDLTADEVAEWDSINHIRLMLAVQEHFHQHFCLVSGICG